MDIEIPNMTLVNGNINSRPYVGNGILTFHEAETLGAFVEGVQGHRRERLSWGADDDFGFPL